jgi:hypothetical protein
MSEILSFWVDIENAAGEKLGKGRLSPSYFDITENLSAAGEFSFDISPADPNYSVIAQEQIVVCRYLDTSYTIQIFGGGKIKEITKRTENGAVLITVSGINTLGELRDRIVGSLQIGDSTGGDTDAPDQIMAFAPSGWSITGGTTAQDVYVRFDDQTVLGALVSVSDGIAEHFRLGSGKVVEWLGNYSAFSASGVRAIENVPRGDLAQGKSEIAIIRNLQEVADSHEIVTRIYPRGAGNGTAILKLESLTESLPAGFTANTSAGYIEDTAAVALYGVIEKPIDFKNISPLSNSKADQEEAANQLMRVAVAYLQRWSTPQKFYTTEIVKVDKLLKPGSTIDIEYTKAVNDNDVLDVDATLNIINVRNRIDSAGLYSVAMDVSTIDQMPVNDTDIIVGQMESEKVYTTHAQLNANARNIDRKGSMDDTHSLTEAFWFGTEVSSIRNIILRFKIDPLRSTIKTVAGSSTTTNSGGGSTSGSGGGTTQSSGTSAQAVNHAHPINMIPGTGAYTVTSNGVSGGLYTSDPSGVDVYTGGAFDTSTGGLSNHTHNVTIPNHTHTTPDHTHTLTPNISTVYGIFEESGANTLSQSDIIIKINGTTYTGSVTSIAGGWYEAEITSLLVDSAGFPNQANNAIEYSTSVAKTAQITTSLAIVDIVQAISIL